MKNIAAVILAAGKGKRMKSELPKVLHEIMGKPMIEHLIETLISLGINKIVVVIGHKADLVKQALADYQDKVEFALQDKQLGTGHAVMVTENHLKDFDGDILVMAGDVPFLSAHTITELVAVHERERAAGTVLSSRPPDASGYGRIVRKSGTDQVERIVEHKDASDEEKKIGEINTGTFCFRSGEIFDALREIKADNSQQEYYLTDVMEVLIGHGNRTAVCLAENADETLGINSTEQLADLEARFGKNKKSQASSG